MRNTHCRTWNMARNNENVKNEKYLLYEPEYGKKPEKV
jgi:hypothetical protein